MSRIENKTAVRSRPDSLQAALAQLKAQRSDPTLAMPAGFICGEALLRVRDTVRLRRDLDGAPSGSEGVILGWYTNEPEKVVVSLSEGGVETVPREALELIDARAAA
ncbi:MAG: hypothetical protein ACYDHO_07375 [Gaiellaceae bacterium]